MGCKPSKATDEEGQHICKTMAQDMLKLAFDDIMKDPKKIKVSAPPSLQVIKNMRDSLNKTADETQAKSGDEEAPAEGEGGAGGMMGGLMNMLGKAADTATEVLTKASDMTAGALAGTLRKAAEGLTKAIDQIENPMSEIGEELAKSAKFREVFEEYINQMPVPNAVELCMGTKEAPCDPKGISKAFKPAPDSSLWNGLREVVATQGSKVVTSWDQATQTYNQTIGQLESLQLPGLSLEKCESKDIKQHIAEQTAGSVFELMGDAEERIRGEPGNKGPHPDLFEKVFKKDRNFDKDFLLEKEYKKLVKEQESKAKAS